MKTLAKFDFGNGTVTKKPGFIKIERVYVSPKYLWMNELRNVWRRDVDESPYRDFVMADEGEFRMGLPKGEYVLRLFFFDPLEDHGPFYISARSVSPETRMGKGMPAVCIDNVEVKQGIKTVKEIKIKHQGEALGIYFSAPSGGHFMVNAMEVEGCEDAEFAVLFPEAPSDILPSVEEVMSKGMDDTAAALRRVCDWLMASRTGDGFIGDYEYDMRLWYTSAFAIRTFLAAFRLLGDKRYLETSIDILDKLVEEQMPEGSFTQAYRNQPTRSMSEAALQEVRSRYWMNLADVGSIVTALACACACVSGDRKTKYTNAVRKYCDNWALRFQTPEGGFRNGWIPGWGIEGNYAKNIYSVATANAALTFAVFSRITGEQKYMDTAEKALAFMLDGWNEDGRPRTWAHDKHCPDGIHYQEVTEFGDLFYTHEGVIGVARLSSNKELRRRAFATARKHIFGSEGLIASKKGMSWWPTLDFWHNSKSLGMPIAFLDFLVTGPEFGASRKELEIAKKECELCRRFLCTPGYAGLMGAMLQDPLDVPFPPHGIQSWTGCTVAATGFMGIALAEMIEPGITFKS